MAERHGLLDMTKDVLVTIQGLHFEEDVSDEELEQVETICPGEYYLRNQGHYVLFQEMVEGFAEPVKTMIKLKNKELTLTRKGPVNVQMVFTEGKKTMTDYMTPFGNILLGLDTSQMEIEETEDKMKIHIKYVLEANYQYVSDCQIHIEISSVQKTE